MFGPIRVEFGVPAEAAFDYLANPRNRPQWQSSLRRIEPADPGEQRLGQHWVDVTVPGLRPRMTVSEFDRPRRWAETGRWRGLAVVATLDFEDSQPFGSSGSCVVTMRVRWTGAGWARLAGTVVGTLGAPALAADLRRAARIAAGHS